MSKIRLVTEVPFPEADVKVGFSLPVAFMGSCFSVHMASEMKTNGLPVWSDPFGISFNPISIAENLKLCLEEREIRPVEFFEHEGRFRHFRFHSSSSGTSREGTCTKMNSDLKAFRKVLSAASHLFVTFGTAWVYRKEGSVVNNCHKLPGAQFSRSLLTVQEILESWTRTLTLLRTVNPDLNVAFSLSPVRHWKDGAEGNSLSKAILRLAIEEIHKKVENASYIPSYEFIMDECRDYRFYASDLLHPSPLAISLIWERLSEAYLDQSEAFYYKRFRELKMREGHRSLSPGSESEQSFNEGTDLLRESLVEEMEKRRWVFPS